MKRAGDALIIAVGAALVSASFNLLLIPHHLITGGLSGVAMLIGYLTEIPIGRLYLLLNVPIVVWGLMAIGRYFVWLSVLSVALTVLFMEVIPVRPLASDPLLAAVFGGVLVGAGSGLSLRIGGSTGGFDIVASILLRKRDFPIGSFLFLLNGIVIAMLGAAEKNWDLALLSLLSMYLTGRVVDYIHIRHEKVTAWIVTKDKDAVLKHLENMQRGATVFVTEGGYTGQQNVTVMVVITRYELAELKKAVAQADPRAFVNIVETVQVLGEFRRE